MSPDTGYPGHRINSPTSWTWIRFREECRTGPTSLSIAWEKGRANAQLMEDLPCLCSQERVWVHLEGNEQLKVDSNSQVKLSAWPFQVSLIVISPKCSECQLHAREGVPCSLLSAGLVAANSTVNGHFLTFIQKVETTSGRLNSLFTCDER